MQTTLSLLFSTATLMTCANGFPVSCAGKHNNRAQNTKTLLQLLAMSELTAVLMSAVDAPHLLMPNQKHTNSGMFGNIIPTTSPGATPTDLPQFPAHSRSEEHTSELQSLMRISYAVFCLKKKNQHTRTTQPSYR